MAPTSYADHFTSFGLLNESLKANLGELPAFTDSQTQLDAVLQRMSALNKAQEALKAQLRETTKDLRDIVFSGRTLSSEIRMSLKGHYGIRSNKLTEFGIKPFTGRRRQSTSGNPSPETPPPTNPGSIN